MSTEPRATVRVTHRFTASPERVFDAWLDPEKARRWLFATATGQMVRAETDPRVGGTFCFVDRRDGKDIEHLGEYLELDRPSRLVFALCVPMFSTERTRVTVDIVPLDGGGCELTLTHENVYAEYASRTEGGWGMLLDALDATISAAA